MNHLLRSHAPISDGGWTLLDQEATERLTPALAAGSWSTSRDRSVGNIRPPTSGAPAH